jgi:murein DD-endopeptidase MepM/ murein hydrolase activator NlpD
MLVPRKALVMAMMCVIQESTMRNLIGGDLDSVGAFQQRASQGWPASRNVAEDAQAFYEHLMNYLSAHPGAQYWAAVQAVQLSANGQLYAQWRTEAERTVATYGVLDGTVAAANSQFSTVSDTGDYEFYRGVPPTKKQTAWGKESSWDCITRLAQEVNWRAFFVSGKFYFISEDDLLKSSPIAVISEDTPGVEAIDGTYTEGTKSATCTVTCRASKWAAPPGSVVQLKDMGPWNGRWLVNDISRSVFDTRTTITLKKKQPRLPEPSGSNLPGSTSATWTGAPAAIDTGSNQQFKTPGGEVQPVPFGHNTHVIQGEHQTVGLAGYPAIDFGGDAGAPIVAVESGKIFKLSGHDPTQGPSDPMLGVHGPFGWSVYLQGQSGAKYYYTHMGTRSVTEGSTVTAGEQIGTIGDYAKWGGANHTHVGVNTDGTKNGHPDCNDLANAPLVRA